MSRWLSGVRGRVVFTVLAVTAVLYSALGAAGFLAIANGGKSAVRDRVNEVVATLETSLADGAPTLRLTTPDGVEATLVTGAGTIPSAAPDEVQIVRSAVIAGQPVRLVGRASSARLSQSLRSLHRVLWIGIPIAVVLTAAMAGAATSRALRPVADITRLAGGVGPGDDTNRVPVPDTGDEIEDLALTVNEMLDRIAAGFVAHRRFTSDAAHELRTPLMALEGEIELAQGGKCPADDAFLIRLASLASRLETRVDELLLLSALDEAPPLNLQVVDLVEILQTEADALTGRVDVSGDRTEALAMADHDLMSRAVRNLLTNAVRHAKETVSATVENNGGVLWIRVDDDGEGIGPADREHVFQRFRRLDEARNADVGGAGLGLSITASIAAAHKGGVAVGTSPAGGARFSLWLPAWTDSDGVA